VSVRQAVCVGGGKGDGHESTHVGCMLLLVTLGMLNQGEGWIQ